MLLFPKADVKKVSDISYEFLQKNNIRALILDVDNTLIDYYRNISEETIRWADDLKKKGIKLYILSNSNKKQKISEVAGKLDVPYEYFAKKPFKRGFKMVAEKIQERPENIGVVGDQLFTDILGANRCHMFPILVEPIAEKDIWFIVLKRPFENWIKKQYKKKQSK